MKKFYIIVSFFSIILLSKTPVFAAFFEDHTVVVDKSTSFDTINIHVSTINKTFKVNSDILSSQVNAIVHKELFKQAFPNQKMDKACGWCIADCRPLLCRPKRQPIFYVSNYKFTKYLKPDYGKTYEVGIIPRVTGGGSNIFDMKDSNWDQSKYTGLRLPISTYHVSCKSYRPKTLYGDELLTGIVLYARFKGPSGYGFSGEWKLNNVDCKSGYIVLLQTKKIEHIKAPGMVHGAAYQYIFGEDICSKHVIGGGFSYSYKDIQKKDYSLIWKFNSWTFNSPPLPTSSNNKDEYHDHKKAMNPVESKWIMRAMRNWINHGQQNTKVTDQLVLAQKTG